MVVSSRWRLQGSRQSTQGHTQLDVFKTITNQTKERNNTMTNFNHNDGGREDAGYKGSAGDCVTRAISIATGLDYQEVYSELKSRNVEFSKGWCKVARSIKKKGSTPRNGCNKKVYKKYLKDLGFTWIATMGIGTGCKVHLRSDELPSGTIICRLSRHICAVIDGVIQDTYDCSRDGTRCVYGYWIKTD